MKLPKINESFADGFLDGLGAGLFTRLRRPGAPTELIDSRSVEEFLASGEFYEIAEIFHEAHEEYRADNVRRVYGDDDEVEDRAREVARNHGVRV